MPQDELDTIIQDIIAGYPGPAATPARDPHRVISFAKGLALWQANAILFLLLLWLLLRLYG
jgi:hypothetical protein